MTHPPAETTDGMRRSWNLLRTFPLEQSDPDAFYGYQAADTLAWFDRHVPVDLQGALVLDVGGGAGFFTRAFRAAGAQSFLVEPDAAAPEPDEPDSPAARHRRAVRAGRLAPAATVAGDGFRLPFGDATFDVAFTSNVLEHVRDPGGFVAELARVTRPGGVLFVSWNTWYSPNGGHETAPWHYLGGAYAARRYTRRHGHPPKNRYGESLFRCTVGRTLRRLRALDGLEVVRVLPRYHPRWLLWVIRVPVVRELATWNALVVFRRR